MEAVVWNRFQFAFTITYHYLFPQLSMGLAFLIVIFKVVAYHTGNARYNEVARFWARIFGINFVVGVITGIPMEFQFGTNWARFSAYSGGVIGIMGLATLLLWRNQLLRCKPMLWILLLAFPFPYIATTAGWATAELGRQPWLIYGLMRTVHGTSPQVSGGNVAFSTLGFLGLYAVMGILFLYLVNRELARGPERASERKQEVAL